MVPKSSRTAGTSAAAVPSLMRSPPAEARLGSSPPISVSLHGVYGHVSPSMRSDLTAALQQRGEGALRERAELSLRSGVPILDALLGDR
jgi:hypothetical protein